MRYSQFVLLSWTLGIGIQACAQNPVPTEGPKAPAAEESTPVPGSGGKTSANYVLGPGDQVTLFVTDLDEVSNKPMRVSLDGDLSFPLAGHFKAGGLTPDQLEIQISNRLKKFVKDPQVAVSVTDLHSQPVYMTGAVTTPGPYQLEGHKTLFEALTLAGGIRADAGNTISITRDLDWGRIPLPGAQDDPSGKFSVAQVPVRSVTSLDASANILVKPKDVISVSEATMIYCLGNVHKPGGFTLGQDQTMSTLQILSLAEGLDKNAAAKRAVILRVVPGSTMRAKIPVNLKDLMADKIGDVPLKSNDILFIPSSAARAAGNRTLDALQVAGSGIAIYAAH